MSEPVSNTITDRTPDRRRRQLGAPFRRAVTRQGAAALGATVALGLGAAGIAAASIPDSGGVIHGCYRKFTGALKVINTAKLCSHSGRGIALFEGFELRHVDVGEVALRARYGGRGSPVVLIHGHPRTHTTWHRVAPRLAESFFVVCPDLRGYGQIPVAPGCR